MYEAGSPDKNSAERPLGNENTFVVPLRHVKYDCKKNQGRNRFFEKRRGKFYKFYFKRIEDFGTAGNFSPYGKNQENAAGRKKICFGISVKK